MAISISVVIPCFNSSTTIAECILSVINQTHPVNEIIAIDDGSTDKTVEILEALKSESKLAITILKQANAGPSTARNAGIELSVGSYIAFLDSDDKWLPEKIDSQVQIIESYGSDLILVGSMHANQYKNLNNSWAYKQISTKELLWKNCFATSTVLVRKDVLNKNKFNTNQKYSEDYALWLKLSLQGKLVLMNQRVTFFEEARYGRTGLSSHLLEMEKGELSNLKALFNDKQINTLEYVFFASLSISKFLRRMLLSAAYQIKPKPIEA